jgi:hypothetical protein
MNKQDLGEIDANAPLVLPVEETLGSLGITPILQKIHATVNPIISFIHQLSILKKKSGRRRLQLN